MSEIFHKPVMLKEVLEVLDPKPNQNFIDATLGTGGHAQAILERIAPDGILLGIERDPEMLAIARERLASYRSRFVPVCTTYDRMKEITEKNGTGPIAGILFDLGISSWHLEHSERGFSFLRDEPLDMRFNPVESRSSSTGFNPAEAGQTAADLLQHCSEEELARIFEEYGEEPYAKRIAHAIVRERKRVHFERTNQLVHLIVAIKKRTSGIHAATKIFQALRIAVNRELELLENGLSAAVKILAPKGNIAVIAFHGLEARIIKNIFRRWESEEKGKRVPKHAIVPLREEIRANPRARSAHLYIFHHL